MRKACFLFLPALCITLLQGCGITATADQVHSDNMPVYDRAAAVAYAESYALKRNPAYADLEQNCTNFVSQCLVAGGMTVDEGSPPSTSERITYEKTVKSWYSRTAPGAAEKPPHFSVSTSFVRTEDFTAYWQNVIGVPYYEYENTFTGLEQLIAATRPGDIVILYDAKGQVAHLGLVTAVEAYNAFYCGNTEDRLEMSICDLRREVYPRFGVLALP
jgi:hypothetical protein